MTPPSERGTDGVPDLDAILARAIAEHGDRVAAWLRDEPGAWGALAARGVLAARAALGRSLTEAERRAVWRRLWEMLTALRRQ